MIENNKPMRAPNTPIDDEMRANIYFDIATGMGRKGVRAKYSLGDTAYYEIKNSYIPSEELALETEMTLKRRAKQLDANFNFAYDGRAHVIIDEALSKLFGSLDSIEDPLAYAKIVETISKLVLTQQKLQVDRSRVVVEEKVAEQINPIYALINTIKGE